ncbi:MAG: PLP-dependent aminotransferase family protein [Gammaproteobacteria bacterium]|nr:PLP-dependent aminotransferase family protein [Gammaproteobacteria bacterium]
MIEKAAANSYLYEDVSHLIQQMIGDGTLSPGDRVPSLRKLSRQLNLSIATVSQAYVKLEEQGVIVSRPQSGFYVNGEHNRIDTPIHPVPRSQPRRLNLGKTIPAIFRDSRQPGVISLGVANPATELLPFKALTRTIRRVSSQSSEAMISYGPPEGDPELRRQIALRFSETGKPVSIDQVVITSGATGALMIALQAVAKAGDLVAVATPSYFSTLQMIESLGILALEIESDVNTGMSIEALATALDNHDIKAVLVSCNFANPTGSLMPEENKKKLVSMLAERNIPLIEDDVYGELYFTESKPSSCKSFDTKGLVLHCNSFSKTIAPGFRIGWVLAGQFVEKASTLKQISSLSAPTLQQLALAEFLAGGQYDRFLARSRRIYKQQMELMRNAIACDFPPGTRISSPRGGFTLWIQLPRGINTFEVYNRAIEENISITPGPLFSATEKYTNYMRLCAGILWTPDVRMAIQKLGGIISDMLAEKA